MRFQHIFIVLFCCITMIPAFGKGGEESIDALILKCEVARSLSQYDILDNTSLHLLECAKKDNDLRATAYAFFYNGLAKLFKGKGDEAIKVLEIADDAAEKIENDSVRALVLNAKGIYQAMMQDNRYVAQQYFFRSLEMASKAGYDDLQYRVRGNLLTLSQYIGGKSVLENAKAMYDYGVKHKNNEQISMAAYYLATYYFNANDFANAEKYLDIALQIYESYPYEDIASVYSLYANLLMAKGNLSKSEVMAKQAIYLAKQYNQVSMEVDACIVYADVLFHKKDFGGSIEMVKHAMVKASEGGLSNSSVKCYQLLASNFSAQGRFKEAAESLQKANELLNSQLTLNMDRLSHEQQVMHDIEKKESEAKLKQEQIVSQRRFLIMLGVIIFILIILLVSILMSYRKRNVLYRKIVLQNTRAIARQEDLQDQIVVLERKLQATEQEKSFDSIGIQGDAPQEIGDNESSSVGEQTAKTASSGMDEEKLDILYRRLCFLMTEERLYAEPQLTREKMAERLNTNRTYLVRVIKEKTGMNYLQFINSYRINEAVRILSDKDMVSYPLKQIWSDLGFSSPSTFFKLFQQTVGITPSMYRKQFIEVKDENE